MIDGITVLVVLIGLMIMWGVIKLSQRRERWLIVYEWRAEGSSMEWTRASDIIEFHPVIWQTLRNKDTVSAMSSPGRIERSNVLFYAKVTDELTARQVREFNKCRLD